ncbi:GT2 family glycosyltransferase [Propionibacteriaceae bacterium ES.041]|uniref:Glycosyltransferase n=1 Tax=Enemella evansiae TaxID=2016499 RepID=A0A255GAU5_9ACTN|nr:glycosyltransferase [Enemella evansiae]OYO12965.1 glycosyltransferase [Enemella evansiae]OYO19663.1 glycosyltransferase [Enemella evansiae]PFG65578.1 GT2 family glycosyltransferase [Propionibacteriaceae bacterium ES.041]TDO91525.1 GT2 family glycosyltransferase [Enemella evansiae]
MSAAAELPQAPVPIPGGWTVPENRWDLLAGLTQEPPTVSVVVPYYRDQAGLDAIVAALEAQRYPTDRIELIVADDGSPEAPRVASGLAHRVVRQEDRGFRAAAARNLGLAVAEGTVVAFLDGDCVPEPGWLAALTRLPALAPEALVVGRREHRWLTGPRAGEPIEAPRWLADGYAASGDLLRADDSSWRFVISANLAGTRDFLRELGGFDGSLIGYGGEDWEFAERAWHAGALLAHEPAAVVLHDGPDWAGRPEDRRSAKNAESLALARRMRHPMARPLGFGAATLAARLRSGTPAAALVCVDSLLRAHPRTAIAVGAELVAELPPDPRVVAELPTTPSTTDPIWHLAIDTPVRFDDTLPRSLARLAGSADAPGILLAPGIRLTRARALARERRAGRPLFRTETVPALAHRLPAEVDLEGWFGGWWP